MSFLFSLFERFCVLALASGCCFSLFERFCVLALASGCFFLLFERFCVLALASGGFFILFECFCVLALASGVFFHNVLIHFYVIVRGPSRRIDDMGWMTSKRINSFANPITSSSNVGGGITHPAKDGNKS